MFQNVLMRDLESHSNLHGVVDMDQMYLPDGMQPPEYITPDQNETPGIIYQGSKGIRHRR